jgi:Holliday junction resolvase
VRQAARVDGNHAEVVDFLRGKKCSVRSLAAVGKGMPDLLVGYMGMNWIFEVKTDKGKLTEDQEDFFYSWNGQATVVRSGQEAWNVIEATLRLRS